MNTKYTFNKWIWKSVIVFVFLSIVLVSCLKNDFDFEKVTLPTWEPNFSLPLIHSKLNLSKVLGEADAGDMLLEDPFHFLTLIYRSNIFSQEAQEVFTIANQMYAQNYSFSLPGGMNNGDSTSGSYSDNIVFINTNNEILDTLYLKEGNINLLFNSDINQNAKINIVFPTATKNGVPLTHTINLNYTGTPFNINTNIDITGYKLVFDHSGGTFNKLPILYNVTVYNIGSPDQSPYDFNFNLFFQNQNYSKMFGYLNQKDYLFPMDTLSIDIFKNSWFGNFLLEDPKLKIKISNSYGFPLNITWGLLEGINPKTPTSMALTNVPNPMNVNSPTIIGHDIETVYNLDKNNSNIKDVVNIIPHYFAYLFEGHANPSGIYTPNFVLDTSRFKVDVEMEMPLFGRAWDFIIEDTVDFTFEKIEELVYINFKINITNGFPVDSKIQIVITDSLYNPLDSLFPTAQYVIQSANMGPAPDYKVTTPVHKYTEVNLSQTRLTNLTNARKMLIIATLNTKNNGNDIVKFYSDYMIDVRMAARAQLKVNLNNY